MPFTPRVNEYRIQCYIFCPVNKNNNMHGFSFHMAAGHFGNILWTTLVFFIKKYTLELYMIIWNSHMFFAI